MLEELRAKLNNVKEKSPVLLLDDYVELFRNHYSGPVYTFNEVFYNSFDYSEDKLTVIIVDRLENILLISFLKKIKYPVIILCNDIQVSQKVLCYIKTIYKYSRKYKSSLESGKSALTLLRTSENKDNINRFYSEESPEYYYLKNKVHLNKYIEVLSYDN